MFDWEKIGERISKILEHYQSISQSSDRRRLRAEIAAHIFSCKPISIEVSVTLADELLSELDKLK